MEGGGGKDQAQLIKCLYNNKQPTCVLLLWTPCDFSKPVFTCDPLLGLIKGLPLCLCNPEEPESELRGCPARPGKAGVCCMARLTRKLPDFLGGSLTSSTRPNHFNNSKEYSKRHLFKVLANAEISTEAQNNHSMSGKRKDNNFHVADNSEVYTMT